jgi:hypothetical protein
MEKEDLFYGKHNMLEHALNLYATNYAYFPANCIYNDNLLESIKYITDNCHIYMIGEVPIVNKINIYEKDNQLCVDIKILDYKTFTMCTPIPCGYTLKTVGEKNFCENDKGQKIVPTDQGLFDDIHKYVRPFQFDVKYIGQAYGSNGKRNAIERLKKHETLQKIALLPRKKGCKLEIILLEIADNMITSLINPRAKNMNADIFDNRMDMGLDKLFNTTEAERVSLYEAALIRYFQPYYNVHFKNSFPSTNMKLLKDCYDKDFLAIVAEICIDEFPFSLCSDIIQYKIDNYYIANYDLQNDKDRTMFFSQKID